ncbi:mRNA-capping enzyme subunit beta [Oleoguttula sp. CCFEE 5521]
MDITSMLSSDDGPPKKSPVAQRVASAGSTHILSGNEIRPPPPPLSRHSSQQAGPGWPSTPHETDQYAHSAQRPTPGASLTPLQTHGPPGQFPFSGQLSVSPGGYPQQHTPLAHTPGGHPQYLPHQSQPPLLGQHHQQGAHPQMYRQQTSSSSPTPSSQHSQPPYGIRQSPLAAPSHLPHQAPPPHFQQYQSHPSTPLGPPSLQQRGSAHSAPQDNYSPLHQRNLSGISNGIVRGSPAQYHSHIGHPPPQAPTPPEYFNQLDRERSLSVSPKTQVPVRIPSLGSRQSSYQEPPQSARSSVHLPMAQPTVQQNHVMQNGVSQANSHSTPPAALPNATSQSLLPADAPSEIPPPPHHYSEKMGMKHLIASAPANIKQQPPVAVNVSLKRSASPEMLSAAPRTKMLKTRPTERPPWARLHRKNTHYKPFGHIATTNGHGSDEHTAKPTPEEATKTAILDTCLANARELLGGWEASYQGKSLNPSMYKVVQDWLWMKFSDLDQVDPAMLEVEAKIGRLLNKSDGNRANFGISSTCTIAESHNHLLSFESKMDTPEYKAINEALNESVIKAQVKGREPMRYRRIEQTDSSHHINATGLSLIPAALKQYTNTRPPRLRISHDKATQSLKAAIIKLPVSNLHIHAPDGAYDCRISINIELSFLPLLAAAQLKVDDIIDHGAPAEPSRQKNRMNYKHLAYDIDLTAVQQGDKMSYELELEVDAGLLKAHMGLLQRREPSAYVEIVSGFLENAQFLMRAR